MISTPNPLVIKGLLGFSGFSAFLYTIASFVTASYGTSNYGTSFSTSAGEGFMIVMFGLFFCVSIGLSFFTLAPGKFGPIYSGVQLASSIFTLLTALFMAVWAGLKQESLVSGAKYIIIGEGASAKVTDGYISATSTMIAGASLLIIAQTAFLVLYAKWRPQLLSTSTTDSSASAAAYAASYEPGAYFDAAAGDANKA